MRGYAFSICVVLLYAYLRFYLSVVSSQAHEEAKVLMSKFETSVGMQFRNDIKESSSAACLLVMDDNHYLIEWIAYHYHALSLRHLIVATDPRSKTSPRKILERWRNYGISVSLWQDGDYMSDDEVEVAKNWVKRKFGDIPPALIMHRARQRLFYYKCMQKHKAKGRSWTLLTDTDEYLHLNEKKLVSLGIKPPSIEQSGSVLSFLREQRRTPSIVSENNWTKPCVQIPRIRYGAKESKSDIIERGVPLGFNASNFETTRFRYHADAFNNMANRLSKAMVDLSRVTQSNLEPVASIHRPVWNECGQRKRFIRAHEQALILNHYLGTWEQYSYRDDSRNGSGRNRAEYEKAQNFGKNEETDDDIHEWLRGFVKSVGQNQAHTLLEGVGLLEDRRVS